ncbi:MAG: helix-turn-helix domain-containing protein, partial [Clostridiales bacterium]|nr:helix-turn-helix domain-containing protein [Clostridiales bacterium]
MNNDILMHYGMPRRSGRYPWGSGENPYQHSGDFLSRVNELKKQGLSEAEIAESIGLTTTQLIVQKSLAKNEQRALAVETAKGLREKGYSLNEIAVKMGFKNDSSVRSLLNENAETR